MGAGMARNLIGAGLDVTVWNRSPDRARPLADAGARIATDAAEAVAGADVVVTMLFDADAVAAGDGAGAPGHGAGRGVGADARPSGWRAPSGWPRSRPAHDVAFVDAPVLGTKAPAEQGDADGARRRPVGAAGRGDAGVRRDRVEDACGSGSSPATGTSSSWSRTRGSGSVDRRARPRRSRSPRALGLDPQLFLDAIAGGPLDMPVRAAQGQVDDCRRVPDVVRG